MVKNIVAMVLVFLIKVKGFGKLRDKYSEHVAEAVENILRTIAAKQSYKLRLNALGGDIIQKLRIAVNRGCSFVLNRKAVARSKPQRAENTQSVLTEPLIGIADTANKAISQIAFAAVKICYAVFIVVGDSIDGEISACQILSEVRCKCHALGMSVVTVFSVNPIGGYFKRLFVNNNRDCSVLDADVDGIEIFKAGFDLLRLCRGADVPVMRSKSEQAVTDTAADGKSLKARILKSVNDQFSILRYLHIIS